MKKRVASVALVGTMGLGAVGGLALPSWAETATTATGDRVARIADALKGLVGDGTLTQAQADKVASTLAESMPERGPGGHGPRGGGRHLEAAATVLGMSVEDLRAALESGKSLVDVAQTKGISRATLINRLVAAAEAHLAEHVKAGDMTQAQADARKAMLRSRITEMVDRQGLPARPDRMPRQGSGAPSPTSTI